MGKAELDFIVLQVTSRWWAAGTSGLETFGQRLQHTLGEYRGRAERWGANEGNVPHTGVPLLPNPPVGQAPSPSPHCLVHRQQLVLPAALGREAADFN